VRDRAALVVGDFIGVEAIPFSWGIRTFFFFRTYYSLGLESAALIIAFLCLFVIPQETSGNISWFWDESLRMYDVRFPI